MATEGLMDMTKSYCLTVEVGSDSIKNGLGYMVTFSVPDEKVSPQATPGFTQWSDQVRDAVLRAGDQVFDPDTYTKKVAIAELMYELSVLSGTSGIIIASDGRVPAVQIQSTNPYDPRIEINFTSTDGDFHVSEKSLSDLERRKITGHGATGVQEAGRGHFPFVQQPPVIVPPKNIPGAHPHSPRP